MDSTEMVAEHSMKHIKDDHDFFKDMLSLLPTNFYVSYDEKEQGETDGHESRTQNTIPQAGSYKLAGNYTQLQQHLQEKITSFREKRKAMDVNLQRKKIKRKESMEVNRKLKKKPKHVDAKRGNHIIDPNPTQSKTASKPIFNKEGKIVFSKFDFSESGHSSKDIGGAHGKDFRKLLEKIEQQKRNTDAIKQKGEKAANNNQEKLQWQRAVHKAEGIKIRDDPQLLKNSLKKKDKRKAKSKKNWHEREEITKKRMSAVQDKRKKNISKKKNSRINQKIAKSKTKGRIIPGF